jgi:hypothetical protein
VTGTVTHGRNPVASALITFHAQGEGQNATALTGEDGTFSALTYFDNGRKKKPGMVPGEYLVTVTKLDPAPVTSPGTPPKNLLPERYATPSSSGLHCTVTEGGTNHCNLEL